MADLSHIFWITPQFGRGSGGLGVSAERIVGGLRQDYDVTVFVPERTLSPRTYAVTDHPGLTLVQWHGGHAGAEALQFLNDLLLRFAEDNRPVQIHGFYTAELSFAAALAARYLMVPFVAHARGNDLDLEVFGEHAFQVQFALKHAHTVFCVTRELEAKVQAFSTLTKTKQIPNGVDEIAFPALQFFAKDRGGKIKLGLFGDIKAKKGLDFLLAACDFETCDLDIVGSLREEAARLLHGHLTLYPEAARAVTHVPFVKSAEKILEHFAAVDVVCIPSYHEGMSNVMLEAMSCGCVVLASAVGGARDVIAHGENGFLFRPRDLESFKTTLAEVDHCLRTSVDSIRRNARQTVVENFSAALEQEHYLTALKAIF